MALDQEVGGGVTVAQGLMTLAKSSDAIAKTLADVKSALIVSQDMRARFSVGGASRAAANKLDEHMANIDPTAGQTKSTGRPRAMPRTFDQARADFTDEWESAQNRVTREARAGQTSSRPGGGSLPPAGGGSGPGSGGTGGGGGRGPGSGGGGGHGGPGGGAPAGPHGPSGGGSWGAGQWARRNLPFVGLGMDALGELRSQRDKNRQYQNIQGGSNFDAFGDRASEEIYRFSTSAVFSEREARQAFKGVTRLGFNDRAVGTGVGRQAALDFAYGGKTSYGADVGESLDVLQTASRDTRVSLTELSSALKDVSDTAGTAGVNANLMRQNMAQMLGVAQQQGYGQGSVSFARNNVGLQASYGRGFQNTSFARRGGADHEYMVAARFGMTGTQFRNINRTDPTKAAAMRSQVDADQINNILGPGAVEWLNKRVADMGGKQAVIAQPAIVDQIASDFWLAFPGLDEYATATTLSSLVGVDLTPANAIQWVVQNVAGGNEYNEAKGNQAATQRRAATDGINRVGMQDSLGSGTFRNLSKASNKAGDMMSKLGPFGGTGAAKGLGWLFGTAEKGSQQQSEAGRAYADMAGKSGKADPVLEALLNNVRNPDDTKVVVNTRSGPREMSLADAIKLYPNELAAGNIQISSGDHKGQTTGALAGVTRVDQKAIDKEYGNKANAKRGDEYKQPKRSGSSGSGTTTVTLSPDAQKLLRLLPGDTGAAAAEAGPPIIPQTGSR